MPSLVEIGPVVLEKKIFKFVSVFSLFCNYLPWTRVRPFIWTKLNRLLPTMHCAKFGWNWPSGSGEDFLNFINVFLLFCNYLPLEKGRALHLNKLDSLQPRILCAKFGWNWPSGSIEEENVKSLRQCQHQWRTTDKFWSEKLIWAFGSGELTRGPQALTVTWV